MKVEFWAIGKTNEDFLKKGIEIYEKRLIHYLPFKMMIVPDAAGKFSDSSALCLDEGKSVFAKIDSSDFLVLLDEKGQNFTSEQFAQWIEKKLMLSNRRLIFLVGGAFGFSPELKNRANALISLSNMTFSHQMVRIFFLEQLYRAMTILRNEPYHNP